MALTVIEAGLQTTLQAKPFLGQRHIGMPACGAADALALAHANRLVGKAADAVALEIALTRSIFRAERDFAIAVTGAASGLIIGGKAAELHCCHHIAAGDEVIVLPAAIGCRSYLACSDDFVGERLFGSGSTHLASGLGGFSGRALQNGDRIEMAAAGRSAQIGLGTPALLLPHKSPHFILRAVAGAEIQERSQSLFEQDWRVGQRSSRMGIELSGSGIAPLKQLQIESAPVFPGTIQCPPSGQPFLLGPDAQTTGGYPRIAQVIRADRHLIGQLFPGAQVRLLRVTPDQAATIYRRKIELLAPWLGPIALW